MRDLRLLGVRDEKWSTGESKYRNSFKTRGKEWLRCSVSLFLMLLYRKNTSGLNLGKLEVLFLEVKQIVGLHKV